MSYPHQPGSPSFEGGASYEAYCDEMEKLRARVERLERENARLVYYLRKNGLGQVVDDFERYKAARGT